MADAVGRNVLQDSMKVLETSRLARSRNMGTGLDGSCERKNAETASRARIASWRDLISVTEPVDIAGPSSPPPAAAVGSLAALPGI